MAAMTVVPWASIPDEETAWWHDPERWGERASAPVEEETAPEPVVEEEPSFTAIKTDRPCNSVVRRSPSGQFIIEFVPCSDSEDDEGDEGTSEADTDHHFHQPFKPSPPDRLDLLLEERAEKLGAPRMIESSGMRFVQVEEMPEVSPEPSPAPASAPSPTSAPPPTSRFCTPAKKAVMDVNVSDTPAKKAKRDGGEEPSGSEERTEEKNQAARSRSRWLVSSSRILKRRPNSDPVSERPGNEGWQFPCV